jgi:leucyl-tRNA synthetase
LVPALTSPENASEVEDYIKRASKTTEMDRKAEGREKTGAFLGTYATNPVNGKQIPIWIADYVLMGYGTGAIMAVPAHDQRDFEFARKFGLPIIPVYQEPGTSLSGGEMTEAIVDKGVLVNSDPFNGLPYNKETVRKVAGWLKERGTGEPAVTYKLRDWLISRQRFWGAPIPVVYCPVHGEQLVPSELLPVELPDVENYSPSGTGESPLATIPEFVNALCPECGGPARRETDTMGGFACSCWYFLRFADPHNADAPFSREAVDYWLPVDMYVGGAEHAVMHLLYARFWTKVLFDAGLVGFAEPFTRLRNQGMMLAWTPGVIVSGSDQDGDEADEAIQGWKAVKPEDMAKYPPEEIVHRWAKMSKSSGNVVRPDDAAEKYGADALRVYEMFVAPFEETVQWKDEGIFGAARFLGRVYRLVAQVTENWPGDWTSRIEPDNPKEKTLRRKTHQTIGKVADDLEDFRFNTAVAALMEWVNAMYEVFNALKPGERSAALDEAVENLVQVIAPFAPHLADELWNNGLGRSGFLYKHPWPAADPNLARNEEITLVVQVNGKVRDKLTAPADSDVETLKKMALGSERLAEFTEGKTIRNVIVVPGRLVNIVAN